MDGMGLHGMDGGVEESMVRAWLVAWALECRLPDEFERCFFSTNDMRRDAMG